MAKTPDWAPFLEAGLEFTEMTRAEARRRAQRLVKEGQLAQDRAQAFVDEMVESSRRRADELVGVVRTEFQRQVDALGLATKDDLAALEAKIGDSKKKKDKKSKDKKSKDRKSEDKGASAKAAKKAAKKAKKAAKAKKTGPSNATVRRNAARKASQTRPPSSPRPPGSPGAPGPGPDAGPG